MGMKKVLFAIVFMLIICPVFAQEDVVLDLSLPEVHKIDTGSLHYESHKMQDDSVSDVDMSFDGIKSMFLEDVLSDELKDKKHKKK